jgi:hypothetical protein
MAEHDLYEEYKVPPQIWGWVMLIVLAIIISGFGMWAHHGIPDPPRYWDHGELLDTPAQSVYSTFEPSPITTQKKIVNPLPEGRPLDKKQAEQEQQKLKEEGVQQRTGRGRKFF